MEDNNRGRGGGGWNCGGGRDGGRGGVGGDRNYGGTQGGGRLHTYPRQNPDPDGFSQSAESSSQTQTRLAGLLIPKRRVSLSNDDDLHLPNPDQRFKPIKRPDSGALVKRSVSLLVNYFPVFFNPSSSILCYDVDIKPDFPTSTKISISIPKPGLTLVLPIPKSEFSLIVQKLYSDNSNQFLQTAYDGNTTIYSAVVLGDGSYNVKLFGRSYTCSIKCVNEITLSQLYFPYRFSNQISRNLLQALNVVMKENLSREKVSVGRGMYPRVHRPEDDLGGGVAASRGLQQSLKVTANGLFACMDYSVVPFRKRIPVIEFLCESVWEINEAIDIPRYRDKVVKALSGLRVSVTHTCTNNKYIVAGLTDALTKDISFELEEGKKKKRVVMLTEYFREKWGKEIEHKDIPCLKLGSSMKANYVPMEFCVLAEDRRYPKEQLRLGSAMELEDLSLLNPNDRMNEICKLVLDEYGSSKNGAKFINNFQLKVGMNMKIVSSHVMAPPQLKLGSLIGETSTQTVDKMKFHWNLLQGRTLVQGKTAERWAVINFNRNKSIKLQPVDNFIQRLIDRCRGIGIKMEEPLVVHHTTMLEFSNLNRLDRLLRQVIEESRNIDEERLQMIVCIMSRKSDGYKYLKWVSETQIGIITQCCLYCNALEANDQFLTNLGMKINAKLGGSNVELIEGFPHFSDQDDFMFIGADVNHPAPSNQSSLSVAAVVGSVNSAATRYVARVSPQTHRKEEIVNFGSLCVDLVNTYYNINGVRPNKIVVFRDGVSDSQFDMVLNKEMADMKKAVYDETNYRPKITFVVAQKRHTTRLFLKNGSEVDNVAPGTVVDTEIVHPFEFDFYLCSHFSGMGTSKPTHYYVIWDENGFTSAKMQELVYHLCYVFARSTQPVSLVPPVYYADLVAYRGRMIQEVAEETKLGRLGSMELFDPFRNTVDQNLKDSMFFV